ncbi:MAG: Gfo/Idh/MocA family oxidoreductase [Planctomycetota bacterium]|nr:Gfo/Idh/MocA family oxidoreductase [Planctomycetota bacterium]
MSKRYRIVQTGCGGMGQAWLKMLAESPLVEIVGLVDIRQEAAEATAEKFGLSKAIAGTSLKKAIEAHKPEIVIDVTIPAAHKDVTLTALAAGCHVLGEKPLADSMANARKMVAAAKKAGRVYMVSQNYRWAKEVRAIRKAIADGLIGDVTTFNIDFYIGAHFGGFRDEMAHPLLLDMSIHHFDMMRCVTGADPLAVTCHEFNPKGSWYKGDVSAVAIFEMSGGLVFNYRGSWCAEGCNTSWNGDWRIIGTKGSIRFDKSTPPTAEVPQAGSTGFVRPLDTLALPLEESTAGQLGSLKRFIEAIESGTPPETSCEDNIQSLAMVFGAVNSAKAGKRLSIAVKPSKSAGKKPAASKPKPKAKRAKSRR